MTLHSLITLVDVCGCLLQHKLKSIVFRIIGTTSGQILVRSVEMWGRFLLINHRAFMLTLLDLVDRL